MSFSRATQFQCALALCVIQCAVSEYPFEVGSLFQIKLSGSESRSPGGLYAKAIEFGRLELRRWVQAYDVHRNNLFLMLTREPDTWGGRVLTWKRWGWTEFSFKHGRTAGRVEVLVVDHHTFATPGKYVVRPLALDSFLCEALYCRDQTSTGTNWNASLLAMEDNNGLGNEWILERAGNSRNQYKIKLVSGEYLTAEYLQGCHDWFDKARVCGLLMFRNQSTSGTSDNHLTIWEFEERRPSLSEVIYTVLHPGLQALGFGVLGFYSVFLLLQFKKYVSGLSRSCWIGSCHSILDRAIYGWARIQDYFKIMYNPDEMTAMAQSLVDRRRIQIADTSLKICRPLFACSLLVTTFILRNESADEYFKTLARSTFMMVCPCLCFWTCLGFRPALLTIRCLGAMHLLVNVCASVQYVHLGIFVRLPQYILPNRNFFYMVTFFRMAACLMFGTPHLGIPCFMMGSMVCTIVEITVSRDEWDDSSFLHHPGTFEGKNIILSQYVLKTILQNQLIILLLVSAFVLIVDSAMWREARIRVELLKSRQSEEIVSALLDSMCDGVAAIDATYKITKGAPRIAAMLQRQPNSSAPLQGTSFADIVHSGAREHFERHMGGHTGEEATRQSMLNTDLCDSLGNKVPVILHITSMLDATEKHMSHLIGVSEQGETPPPHVDVPVQEALDTGDLSGEAESCSVSGAQSSSSGGSARGEKRVLKFTKALYILEASAGFLHLFGGSYFPTDLQSVLCEEDVVKLNDWVSRKMREAWIGDEPVEAESPSIKLIARVSKRRQTIYQVKFSAVFNVPTIEERQQDNYAVTAVIVSCNKTSSRLGTPRFPARNRDALDPQLIGRSNSGSNVQSL